MYCVRAETVVINGASLDVVVADPACTTRHIVATREEIGGLANLIQPLTAHEAGQLSTAVWGLLILAFALGLVIRFVWTSRSNA
jgi:hypothetical protein